MGTNNWRRWGDDDERGSLNLLTPEVVKAAAASILSGRVYTLGIPVQAQGVPLLDFRGKPMRLTLQDGTDDGAYRAFGCDEGTGSHEDVLVIASHSTSHIDALIHVYGNYQHFNGVTYKEMRALSGAGKLGIEKAAGFATRGVLLDMVKHFGGDGEGNDWVTLGRVITADDLQAAAESQGIEVRTGDAVMIRTGYLQYWWANAAHGQRIPFQQPGIGLAAAEWLAERDVVAVLSDNAAVESIPFDNNDFLCVHRALLVDAGIYLAEYINLVEPAADEAYEGLLTVAPLKVTGATGSPVNPIFVA